MIRKNIQEMSQYKPPLEGRTSGGHLLLDFNERTTPVSDHIRSALHTFVDSNRLHTYPEYGSFVERLAKYVGVPAAQLMITNGSDQGIDIIFRATTAAGDEAIIPAPTFAMHTQCAAIQGLEVISPAYTRAQGFPFDGVCSAISEHTRIIAICNPNAPTGTAINAEHIVEITTRAPQAAILVDECYFEYSKSTLKDLLSQHKNIFITRTFSKTWGLASLRIGYLLSHEDNINELLKVRGPYDVNTPAVIAASAALEDPSFMDQYVNEVLEVSRPLLISFLEEHKIPYWPTAANFILICPPDPDAITGHLHTRGILVRPRNGTNIENTVRITIGTKENTQQLISALEEVLT